MAFEWTEEARARALETLLQFEGAPHRHRRCDPRQGVDCVHLVIAALKAAGAVPEHFEVPGYARNVGYRAPRNTAANEFLVAFFCHEIPVRDIGDGDVVFFSVNRSSNHVGISLGDDIWHSLWSSGVTREPKQQAIPRIETALRFFEAGTRQKPR